MKAVFGEGAGEAEWTEGEQQFEKDRDLDHDGVLDWEEVRQWMLPEAYDEHQVRECCDVTHMYDVYNIIDYMTYFMFYLYHYQYDYVLPGMVSSFEMII